MGSEIFLIDRREVRTTALVYGAERPRVTLVLAHGAGAPQTHPWMVAVARALATREICVVTFNFLYTEQKRRAPDKNDLLEATWRAVIDAVRSRGDLADRPLFIGGKSMGGRISTQVAARSEVGVSGLVLLGYPLHPPGKPGQLRVSHLPRVRAPMLFVQGSRDPFGTPEELGPVIAGLAPGTRLVVVEGGDHSFAVRKSTGETFEKVIARVVDAVAHFTA
jgi:uncharacterized protein